MHLQLVLSNEFFYFTLTARYLFFVGSMTLTIKDDFNNKQYAQNSTT